MKVQKVMTFMPAMPMTAILTSHWVTNTKKTKKTTTTNDKARDVNTANEEFLK